MSDHELLKTGVTVVMPTYNQASFISTAIYSLLNQTHSNWELVIINDGSTDDTEEVLNYFIEDKRIRYLKNKENLGLGACLNIGIANALFQYITYLPSDDFIFPAHLETLVKAFISYPTAILVFSGISIVNHSIFGDNENNYKRNIKGNELQLVQVMHRKVEKTWIERNEFTTEDYYQMYWEKLLPLGPFIPTNTVSCRWVEHPDQRHKKIRNNKGGGLNIYRNYYNVQTPLKFKPKGDSLWDENEMYKNFRQEQPKKANGLKILIVGELSFNPERIYALEEAGHELYGLWVKGWWFHTVGPIPFGHIKEISQENWKEEILKIQPDIIYALLNTLVAPFASEVLKHCPKIPIVWHFKEGPFFCRQNGLWNSLQFMQTNADGIIYINDDIRHFYNVCFPLGKNIDYMVLDGELPKSDWFKDKRKPLLSESGEGFHTVVPGRPYGLSPDHIGTLAKSNVHFHFYGESWHNLYAQFVESSRSVAPNHIHLHPNCNSENWTEEFSQYDAGWLHFIESKNNGDYLRTNWEDLNIPARMATLASAGLPMIQRDNTGHIVATQSVCKSLEIGIYFKNMEELGEIIADKLYMQHIRDNVWRQRMKFSFDYHVPELIAFFRKIIEKKKQHSK